MNSKSESQAHWHWLPNTPYKIVLFYTYSVIDDVDKVIKGFRGKCEANGLLGRILVAEEGLNGSLGGSSQGIEDFILYAEKIHNIVNVDWKFSSGIGERLPFVDLFIKRTKELISTGLARDVIENQIQFDKHTFGGLLGTGVHLSPKQFHDAIESNEKSDYVLIDVRNEFEYAIGRFDGAIGLGTDTYAESWTRLDNLIEEHQLVLASKEKGCDMYDCSEDKKCGVVDSVSEREGEGGGGSSGENNIEEKEKETEKEKKVFMYCTGGIRCEKASAYMKAKGVKSVFQLQGGIHRYLETYVDGGLFKGKNFVFDGRVAVPPPHVAAADSILGKCGECTDPYDVYSGARVCTVCRVPVLICESCVAKAKFPDELHCMKHRHLRDVYFTVIERFSDEELRTQLHALQAMEADLISDHRHGGESAIGDAHSDDSGIGYSGYSKREPLQ
eukprot:CAMPEP_0182422016 /NCGR_PEP_ID=MMETSP1167-20130531/7605_1 /TAXON_ID=2988 /ORGANISM="Mallomonas Sp, Strain CCMP3275" /LENGTH=443 /DNA_ID=CAMNT_0024599717 /DNA_START=180 /DNA_END=1512 /DNA_ORIENTATION=-